MEGSSRGPHSHASGASNFLRSMACTTLLLRGVYKYCNRLPLGKPLSSLMKTSEELEEEAADLEGQAVELENQRRPIAAQAKLQQAKSLREQAKSLRDRATIQLQQAGAATAGTGLEAPEWFKEWALKLEQHLRIGASQDMSAASVEAVEEVLLLLELEQLSEMVPAAPEDFVAQGMDPFPMHDYATEEDVYSPYAGCLAAVLKANGLGPEVFAVQIIATEHQLSLPSGSKVFKGFLDLAVSPSECMGNSILRQMRVGLEIKHTKAQKEAHKAGQADPSTQGRKRKSAADQPDIPGLPYASKPKAQAILELLASCTIVQHPVVVFLTDGIKYHRLRLTQGALHVAQDLEPRAALHSICRSLQVASRDPCFSLQQHRALLTDAELAALDKMHQVRGSSTLLDQAEAVMGHLSDPAEKLLEAQSLVKSWKLAAGGAFSVPSWLSAICDE